MELPLKISQLIENGDFSCAISLLDEFIAHHPDAATAYYERGRLHWRLGNHRKAISDYCSADNLAPHGKAEQALNQAREIMDFFNPDIYNP